MDNDHARYRCIPGDLFDFDSPGRGELSQRNAHEAEQRWFDDERILLGLVPVIAHVDNDVLLLLPGIGPLWIADRRHDRP